MAPQDHPIKSWYLIINNKEYPCQYKASNIKLGILILTHDEVAICSAVMSKEDYELALSGTPVDTISKGRKQSFRSQYVFK